MSKRSILIGLSGILLLGYGTALSNVIHVPGDAADIEAGLDAAATGDTVLVAPDIYYEHIVISKQITLMGEEAVATIIDGSGTGDVIRLIGHGTIIQGFTIQNAGGSTTVDGPADAGVKLYGGHYCVVANCLIQNNPAAGIAGTAAEYNTISDCGISNNEYGIYLYEDVVLGDTLDNIGNQIVGNRITYNETAGIMFAHGGRVHHSHGIVRNNFIAGNLVGLDMIMSAVNEVDHNNFNLNVNSAIRMRMCKGGGEGNRFHHNYCLYNGVPPQATDWGGGEDYWYDESTQEGNYWSDYGGDDLDSDGIGDDPYKVGDCYDAEDSGCYDLYPLMAFDDADNDGVWDGLDNCPAAFNPDQGDIDADGLGDVCDPDADGDGVLSDGDASGVPGDNPCTGGQTSMCDDNCPMAFNPDQADDDADGVGDMCEANDCCGLYTGGYTGNTNFDTGGRRNLADISKLVDRVYISKQPLPCEANGNTTGDDEGRLNLADISHLIDHVYLSKQETAPCP